MNNTICYNTYRDKIGLIDNGINKKEEDEIAVFLDFIEFSCGPTWADAMELEYMKSKVPSSKYILNLNNYTNVDSNNNFSKKEEEISIIPTLPKKKTIKF